MFEKIARMWRHAPPEQQASFSETVKRQPKLGF